MAPPQGPALVRKIACIGAGYVGGPTMVRCLLAGRAPVSSRTACLTPAKRSRGNLTSKHIVPQLNSRPSLLLAQAVIAKNCPDIEVVVVDM